MAQKTIIEFDVFSRFFLFGLLLSMLLVANGFYLFACLATFFILFFKVQQPYRTGVFTIMLFQHILQVIASVFQANNMGQSINFRSPENGMAIILSLFGLIALFLPILYFQNKLPTVTLKDFRNSARILSTEKAMYIYIAGFFITSTLTAFSFAFAGLTQIIVSLVKIKWLFFLLFGFLTIIKNEKKNLFYLCIGVEILFGFISFFSDFKTVIYYLLILLTSFIVTINFKQVFNGLLIGSGLLTFALLWTSVKGEYRSFLNSGSSRQNVEVSREDALSKLYDLSNNVDNSKLENSTDAFLDRLQYTYHFAKTIERVPAIIPYQRGANWSAVLQFTTTPRFLNPNKPTIDNSVKTSKYTGLRYLTAKRGTSFSLGYFAECYIDFGYLGMMVPLMLIGLLYGKLYHYFITKASPNLLFNYAVVGSFFMEFSSYETDATYLVGRLFASILTYLVLIYFVFPIVFKMLLQNPVNNFRLDSGSLN